MEVLTNIFVCDAIDCKYKENGENCVFKSIEISEKAMCSQYEKSDKKVKRYQPARSPGSRC